MQRLRRSKLITPGNRPDMMLKAVRTTPDALVLDLEDSVPMAQKAAAREHVRTALETLEFGRSERSVRVNSLSTGMLIEDLFAVVCPTLDAIHITKVEGPRNIWVLEEVLAHLERARGVQQPIAIIPTLESPVGLRNALAIAQASPRIAALQFGVGDLAATLGMKPNPLRLAAVRQAVLFAANEAGVQALDTVFLNVADTDGYAAEAQDAKEWGFHGKTCIHPTQVPIANNVFQPTAAEIHSALEMVEAYDAASVQGIGAISLHGKLVDIPIAEQARRVVTTAKALGLLEKA